MKKRLFVLFAALMMILFSSFVAMADEAEDTEESTAINGTTYYYDHFDNDAYRNVYDQLVTPAETFHESSTANASVYSDAEGNEYYIAFSINVSKKNWEVINAGGMQLVLNAFIADHPLYFWIKDSFTYQCHTIEGSVFYTVNIFCYKDYAAGASRQVIKNNVDLAISEYALSVSEDSPDYEKAYIVHNAIIDDASYNQTYTQPDDECAWAFSVDGICNGQHKSATSFGYARTFKAVMDELGITCIYVEGNEYTPDDADAASYNTHAWNCVYLDGEWYIIDVAYDDPETTTGKDVLTYNYFNITSEEASDLEPDYDLLPGIPTCNGTAYSIENIQSGLESQGLWEEDNYNFFDHLLDTYGVSVVLISIGLILILIGILIRHMHKRNKKKQADKIKNTKVTVVDHSDLDKELKRPPLS